jgi:DNA-binding protein YbaB
MLEDVTVAAIAAAQTKAAEMMKDEMAKLANEVGLPPGMLPG